VTGGNHKRLEATAVATTSTMASGNNETAPLYCGSGMDNFHTR